MLFHSPFFPVFLGAVLALYYGLPRRFRLIVLLVAGYVFYAFWDWRFCGLLLLSTTVDYVSGLGMAREGTSVRARRAWMFLSVGVNLGSLLFFKYSGFFVAGMATLLETAGVKASLPVLQVVLPVGISFYTFQSLSYTLDVWWRRQEPVRDPILFLSYVSFFPQLVAGPIERASDLVPQLAKAPSMARADWREASFFLLSGFTRKVLLGDSLAPFVDKAFANWATLDAAALWEGAILFSLQIYFDFSGYSDIARGVARLFGVRLRLNFRQPYFATSLGEFWRRWHLSLSEWLRDYLYVPLGGSQGSKLATYRNLFFTFLISGLWHGASATFVLWGAWHGAWMVLEKAAAHLGLRVPKAIGWVGTQLVVVLGFVMFRSPSFAAGSGYLNRMASFGGDWSIDRLALLGGLGIVLLMLDGVPWWGRDEFTWLRVPLFVRLPCEVGLTLAIALIVYSAVEQQPFLYFQF